MPQDWRFCAELIGQKILGYVPLSNSQNAMFGIWGSARLKLGAGGAHETSERLIAQRGAAAQADSTQRAEQHGRPAHHAVDLCRAA